MIKIVKAQIYFISILTFFCSTNISSAAATHLDDDFESYADNTELHAKWTIVHWSGQKDPNANFSTGLGKTAGVAGGKGMRMKYTINEGVNPVSGLGANWDPCSFGITGFPVDFTNQDTLTNYSGVSLWIKPGTLLGDALYFKLNLLEDSSNGREKWMSPKINLSALDTNGQYIYLDFNDFWEYFTASGEAMDRTKIERSYLFLAYDNTTSQYSEATVWVDDITYVESVSYVRNPYLQNVTQTDVKVMWGDNNSSNEPIFWGSSPGNYTHRALSSVITANDGSQIHTATISGLTAGEKVYYTVGNANWGDATYYAVAAPAGNADFRFAFYSDSHTGNTKQGDVISTMLTHNPDIAIHGGDRSWNGTIGELNNYYFNYGAPLIKNTPVFSTIGNHDMEYDFPTTVGGSYNNGGNPSYQPDLNYDPDIVEYQALFDHPTNNSIEDGTEDYYSFDYGSVHFICLNTQRTQKGGRQGQYYYNSTYNDSMRAWLERDLQGTSKPWKVAYFHKRTGLDYVYDQKWQSLFEQYGVQLVLMGHNHNYQSYNINNVAYIISGGGGGGTGDLMWGEWQGYTTKGFRDNNFLRIDVTTTELNVRVFDENNVIRHWTDIDPSGNATYPSIELVDDFEDYTNDIGLQGAWAEVGDSNATSTNPYFDTGGITGGSNVMRVEFRFANEQIDGYGWVGRRGGWNLSGYKAIKLWVQANTTGYSNQYFKVRIHEGFIGALAGEKYESPQIDLNTLTSGKYIYLNLADFTRYDAGGGSALNDGILNKATIVGIYLVPGFNGTAIGSGSSSIMIDNINAIVDDTTEVPTLNDNFDSYANNSALLLEWDKAYRGGNDAHNPPEVTMSRSLSSTGGFEGSQAMKLDFTFQVGVAPNTTGLGENWEPCIYGIVRDTVTTSTTEETNLSNYAGLKLWIKPGTITGNESYFKMNLLEAASKGGEKWMSPKVVLSNLDSTGEYVYLAFDDFYEYYTGSGEEMSKNNIILSYLWLAYDNTSTQNSSATVWVDDIEYLTEMPPAPTDTTQLDDDFEKYANTTELLNNWGGGFTSNSGATITTTLSNINGIDNSNAVQLDFTFDQGVPPRTGLGANWEPCIWGITGKKIIAPEDRTDMTEYTGVRLWLKPGTITGDSAYFKLNLNEDQYNNVSGGAEKWMSPKVYFKDLDPNGEYVYFDFKDFYEYFTGSNQEMDRTSIWKSYLWLAYDDTASQNSSATIWIDDIRLVRRAYKIVNQDLLASTLPEKFALHQNYPNPFNPVTTIQYDIPKAGDVNLVIYDVRGREVIRLVNDRLEAGYYHTKWNGKDYFGQKVASGVYIYLLQSGDYIKSKKLLLIK